MSDSTTPFVLTLSCIQQKMSLISMPIFLTLGTVGNLLNCLVFLQKTLRSNSCSIYFVAASIAYLLFLDFSIGTNLYAIYFKDPTTYISPYCKFRTYFLSSCLCAARFILAFACVDRYAMCSRHSRIRNFSQPRIAAYVIAIIVGLWILIPIHVLVFYKVENGRCTVPEAYLYFNAAYSVLIGAALPPGIMIVFSALAVRSLRGIRKSIRQAIVQVNNASIRDSATTTPMSIRIKQHDHQLLKMLLVDVILYCLSNIPPPMSNIYSSVTLKWNKTPEQIQLQNFFTYLVSQFFIYFSTSASLYTNLMISKTFRHELISALLRHFLSTRRVLIRVYTNGNTNNTVRPINGIVGANTAP
ncbi:unnamed protein product [Rotaria socialis]|uniref:G-protein coupled receptors family 1 profile domain-containing protein n=4 Tax=Rotaria socialis TaxID=392032 RepID=A0A821IQT5_9BILA|nr:unnamed protein product [Rotaria socialis]